MASDAARDATRDATSDAPGDPAGEAGGGWTRAQRRLHWWTAALVVLTVPLGLAMVRLPVSLLLVKFLAYQVHKTIGIVVFLLIGWRLTLRMRRGRPEWDADMPAWRRRAASIVHCSLYVCLLVTPLLGYFTAATAPIGVPTLFFGIIPVPHIVGPNRAWFDVVRVWHLTLALVLSGLVVGHVAAAIGDYRLGGSALPRMWRGSTERGAGRVI